MRDVDQVALQASHDRAKVNAALKAVIASGKRHRVEISRQRAALRHAFGRADEEILALTIKTGKRANDIANVSSYAELRHATDVDRNSHEQI
jgi:uncharacterized tellurite resistance protein B-like protein